MFTLVSPNFTLLWSIAVALRYSNFKEKISQYEKNPEMQANLQQQTFFFVKKPEVENHSTIVLNLSTLKQCVIFFS